MAYRHLLYLIPRAAPPALLAGTQASRTTQSLVRVATLDLNRDHRFELVLETVDHGAPIGTAIFELQANLLVSRGGWSCKEAGLVAGNAAR
jgi:hypothetical protein